MVFMHALILRGVTFAGKNPLPLYKAEIKVAGVFRGDRCQYFETQEERRELSTTFRALCKSSHFETLWLRDADPPYLLPVDGTGENWPTEQSSRGIAENVFALLLVAKDKVVVIKGK